MSKIPSASHRVTNDVIFGLITSRITPASSVLDFGAGRGHMADRVAAFFESAGKNPRDHVTACEIVPEVFQCKTINCVKIGVDSRIPFEDSMFDLIYAIEVLEHTFRPYDFISEAFAKLRPGGWLIFSVPNALHMKSRFSFLLTGFPEMFGPPSSAEKNAGRICGHIMPLNYSYFVYGLRRAGFGPAQFFHDRLKRSSKALSLLLYPFLKLGTAQYLRGLRAYDPEVYEENKEVVTKMNSLEMLSSRSCIIAAQKPSG